VFFQLDLWQEIWGTVRQNKLRTVLTGFAVAWGIFMLVVLLAFGRGLHNNVVHQFRDDAINSIWIHPGQTSKAWKGHQPGRFLQLTDEDHQAIARLPGVEHITSRFFLRGNNTIARGAKTTSFDVRSVHPAHRYLEGTIITEGRWLDELDLTERRKVAVIGDDVRDFFFSRDEEPIGQWLTVAGIQFRVVGVFHDEGGEGELKKIFLPITTAQMAFGGANRVNMIMFTLGTASLDESVQIERQVQELLSERHHFDPDDRRALRIRNNLEHFNKIATITLMIQLFVWIVGALTILAGIVGVSNIMLIAVKERTREIGVRKALGATPRAILSMITQEALVLTAVSGYLGLVAGVGCIELIRRLVPDEVIRNPEVDLKMALTATVLLVISGTLAGFFPAWRAARINPIEALRDD
jgi:putative ABC transport system permease protein